MKAERYNAVAKWFRARPAALRCLHFFARLMVLLVYALYIGMLTALAWHRNPVLWRMILVPGLVFVSGSLLRAGINRPRPYETLPIHPLSSKATRGRSMPSRHVFCAAAIAVAAWQIAAPLGALAGMFALCICVTRVLEGVHYPSDALVGLAYGAGVALLGFALLP